MLPDALAEIVRGVGAAAGDCLLLDARRGRALVNDPARVYELCLNLKRAGFTRMVDFTGTHESRKSEVDSRSSAADTATSDIRPSTSDPSAQAETPAPPDASDRRRDAAATDEFTLQLTLRHPEHGHAALILKWRWQTISDFRSPIADLKDSGSPEQHSATDEAFIGNRQSAIGHYNASHGAGQPGDELQAGSVFISEGRSEISDREVGGGSEMSPTADKSEIGNRQSSIHPSLAAIWPAASIAEREIFEMLGIPFAGNDLDPLLLEAHFTGNPLRRDYAPPQQESYIERTLRERHAEGLANAMAGSGGVSPPASTDADQRRDASAEDDRRRDAAATVLPETTQ